MPILREKLKQWDHHSTVAKEFRVHTAQGALLSVFTCIIISYLAWTEFRYNFKIEILEKVHANATSARGIELEFDITLHSVACAILAIDADDPTGQKQSLHLDKKHHVWKHRLSKDGTFVGRRSQLEFGSSLLNEQHLLDILKNETSDDDVSSLRDIHLREVECGSCYGAGEENECCNTCDDVKRAYQLKGWIPPNLNEFVQCHNQVGAKEEEGEGCNVHGKVALSTGGGNLHLTPNRNLDDGTEVTSILDLFLQKFEQFNVSHTIISIRFGQEYPGHVHQLDNQIRIIEDSYGMYQYYFQIVPTTYKYLDGRTIETNQYSVTEHMRHVSPGSGRGLPGVFLFYEVSPLHVVIEEYRKGWVSFFTSLAAIVGGTVTVMGILDQALYFQFGSRLKSGLMR
jgi:endoplasmic reticulum-Golgi intermediate compartment protein 3